MAKANQKGNWASDRDFHVLRKPVITEKTSVVGGDGSCVVFEVDGSATKPEIRRAVERIYDVSVAKVRTCRHLGKLKRTTSSTGRQASSRRAYVTLKPGQTIDVVEGL